MTLVGLTELGADQLEQLAQLTLIATREDSPEWIPDLEAARAEIAEALAPHQHGLALLDATGRPMAWVAAVHDWGCVWELQPLIVGVEHQRHGHGRQLVAEIEKLAAAKGALTMMVGTSDTSSATSLADCDLYDNTFARLDSVEMRRPHALSFWRRIGYRIVGIVPDAEGPGRPSITLARRL